MGQRIRREKETLTGGGGGLHRTLQIYQTMQRPERGVEKFRSLKGVGSAKGELNGRKRQETCQTIEHIKLKKQRTKRPGLS